MSPEGAAYSAARIAVEAPGGTSAGMAWFCLAGKRVKGQGILVVDAVLDSGVTQRFLLRRPGEGRTNPASAARIWSRITSASGLHLTKYGSRKAWPPATGLGQILKSFLQNEPCGPKDWQRTEKESMIEVACGFRN